MDRAETTTALKDLRCIHALGNHATAQTCSVHAFRLRPRTGNIVDFINYLLDASQVREMSMTKPAPAGAHHVGNIRAFNRFYTRQLGLLEEGLLKSEFSLTELRILYELAHAAGLTPGELERGLSIDAGYLSRMLSKFETRGLITRKTSTSDRRQTVLDLTRAGRNAFAPLNRASEAQIAALLEPLVPLERDKLVQSMRAIERLLGGKPAPKVPYVLRGLQVGDIGWVIHRQGLLYEQEYGWDETFEVLVAEIASAFARNFDRKKERCWIAEREGEIVGSVFLVRASNEIAKLRLLYVEPSARHLGIGRRLVEECVRFARSKRYKTVTLWTNDVLVSARHIYQRAGFHLVKEERHHSFGKNLIGQYWELAL
jgi:DNA-binding MarR family transcriptional regulator/N-acetylglutamate synthase-like GNAT family acetyltransferase